MIPANALRRLDYVFAAIDHGSLRQAARALGVRESSVSRNIIALEQSLDMQLFDRSVHGVRLTDPGQAWANAARVHYEGLNDALSASGGCEAHALRLGLSALAGRDFLAHLLRRFGALYPRVDVVIEDTAHDQGLSAIRRRQLDILFTSAGAAPSCSTETFGQRRLFVLLPAHHQLAAMSAVGWSDIKNEHIFLPTISKRQAWVCPLLDDLGATPAKTSPASAATAILQVQLGQGVFLAEEGFARSVTPELTTWRPLTGEHSIIPINAVWLQSNPKRALLRLLGTARRLAKPSPSNAPGGLSVGRSPLLNEPPNVLPWQNRGRSQ